MTDQFSHARILTSNAVYEMYGLDFCVIDMLFYEHMCKIAKYIYIYISSGSYLRFGLDILIITLYKLEEIYLLHMSYRQRMGKIFNCRLKKHFLFLHHSFFRI
jgi:hypothetical protein